HYLAAVRLTERFKDVERAHFRLGLIYLQQRRFDEARMHFTRALEINPGMTPAYNHLGTIAARQGRYPEAEALLRRAVQAEPRVGLNHYNLGYVLCRLGQMEEGRAEYRKAVDLAKGWLEDASDAALMYATAKDPQTRDPAFALYLAEQIC